MRGGKNFIDLSGQPFGRLLVLYQGPHSADNKVQWYCQCDCGTQCLVRGGHLRNGTAQSCGCRRKELLKKRATFHGMRHTVEYKIFLNMKQRCNNPKNPDFPEYGGRGIRVEWESFQAFYVDMKARPSPRHSVDRIDGNGNYSRENCR